MSEKNSIDAMSTTVPSKTNILLVDDQISVRTLLRNALNEAGLKQIYEADDGVMAIETLMHRLQVKDPIHLILCDWNMPRVDGLELLKRIRAAPGGAHIPFIMITSNSDFKSVKEAIDAGANNYIPKPWSKDQLIAKLKFSWDEYKRKGG